MLFKCAEGKTKEVCEFLRDYTVGGSDNAVIVDERSCAYVKFNEPGVETEYRSPAEYAGFIVRSLFEELGLDVVKAKYMSSRYHAKKDVLMLNFIVVVEDKPIKLQEDELAEARWCTPEEALQLIRKNTTAEYFLTNAVRELKKKI